MMIRERYATGETQGQLARDYEVSIVTVGRIVRGETWGETKMASVSEGQAKELMSKEATQRMIDLAAKHGALDVAPGELEKQGFRDPRPTTTQEDSNKSEK